MPDTPPATCPQCGQPLDTTSTLCPACLLQRGLESNTLPTDPQPTARWTPPTIDELSASFPDLDLLELLGRGGMGAVYKARQKSLDRIVALKILPPEVGRDPNGGGRGTVGEVGVGGGIGRGFAERFAKEAQAMARLNHPNIVTIYDFGQRPGIAPNAAPTKVAPTTVAPGESTGLEGSESPKAPDPTDPNSAFSIHNSALSSSPPAPLFYFLMEYVDGLSLRQLLNRGTVTSQEALAIVPQICEALQYAHDRGIVHRDIKPENLLLNRQGQVKNADFGLAKLMGRPAEDPANPAPPSRTTEKVMGTPQYMAPEQLEHPADVDHRADIYSLGVVFYQMLTGELPLVPIQA